MERMNIPYLSEFCFKEDQKHRAVAREECVCFL